MTAPQRPPQRAIDLIKLGTIVSIAVDYKQTGTDTADTFVTICGGSGGKLQGKWETYSKYLEVGVDYKSIARVKRNLIDQYDLWKKFERENAAELKMYKRLKAKFGEVE